MLRIYLSVRGIVALNKAYHSERDNVTTTYEVDYDLEVHKKSPTENSRGFKINIT